MRAKECFISVDVETTGPIPGLYSMLEIGATRIEQPEWDFNVHVKVLPETRYEDEALKAIRVTREKLEHPLIGTDPREAMKSFDYWIETQSEGHVRPVFAALNAPFDWMFVAWYFHTFLGRNPFGYNALDLKAYFMGREGVAWAKTGKSDIDAQYPNILPHTHGALDDARKVAEQFRLMQKRAHH